MVVREEPGKQKTRSWRNSRITSDNTAYCNRFLYVRSPMGRRAAEAKQAFHEDKLIKVQGRKNSTTVDDWGGPETS